MGIREEIVKIISRRGEIRTFDLLGLLSRKVTRQYVSGVLRGLTKEGKLVKNLYFPFTGPEDTRGVRKV